MNANIWNNVFAPRTQRMKRNAIRELLKLTTQPGMISFAGGLPASELFPMEHIEKSMGRLFNRYGAACLQYGETEGIAVLRDWIANQFSTTDCVVKRENVLITHGSQQGLDLLGRIFLDNGDSVMVESPTYLALLSAWRPWDVDFIPGSSDNDGLCINQLISFRKHSPKMLYLVPNFQNPQGTCLSLERRIQLIEWLAKNNVLLVEDNPYGELRFEGDPLPNLFEIANRGSGAVRADCRAIYAGSFSKVLVPGLRLGYLIAAEPVIDKLVQAKQACDLHTSSFSQYLVWDLIQEGLLSHHVPMLRSHYRERRNAMLESLADHFSSLASWTVPQGGMFLYVRFKENINTANYLSQAIAHQTAFVPGGEFYPIPDGANCMRLNFSFANPEKIKIGIERLSKIFRNI